MDKCAIPLDYSVSQPPFIFTSAVAADHRSAPGLGNKSHSNGPLATDRWLHTHDTSSLIPTSEMKHSF